MEMSAPGDVPEQRQRQGKVQKTFRASKLMIAHAYGVTLTLVTLPIAAYFHLGDVEPAGFMISAVFFGAAALVALVIAESFRRFRIEVHEDQLRVYQGFRWRTIPFDAVVGYRVTLKDMKVNDQHHRLPQLELVGTGNQRLLRVFMMPSFANWVVRKFEPVEPRRRLALRAHRRRQQQQQEQQPQQPQPQESRPDGP